jgi:hypothetical protein
MWLSIYLTLEPEEMDPRPYLMPSWLRLLMMMCVGAYKMLIERMDEWAEAQLSAVGIPPRPRCTAAPSPTSTSTSTSLVAIPASLPGTKLKLQNPQLDTL